MEGVFKRCQYNLNYNLKCNYLLVFVCFNIKSSLVLLIKRRNKKGDNPLIHSFLYLILAD